jgi:hypothetical protein
MQQLSKQPAFELGQIVATPGALAALKKAGQQPGEFPHAPRQPRVIVTWNLFGKQQYSIDYICLVRGTKAVVIRATPPGTKACDAVGGRFRPKWRAG